MNKQEFKQLIKECLKEIQVEKQKKSYAELLELGAKYVNQFKEQIKKEFGV